MTRDPEHWVCLGFIGATLMSNVDKLWGLASSMMTISVEIRSSNLMVVMMTTTVAMKTDITDINYSINACSSVCRGAGVHCRTDCR